MLLTDFKVLTFDCYGTLIDWETGMVEALKPLTSRTPLGRNAILQAHARHESRRNRCKTPTKLYRDLLATVYKRLAEEWGIAATLEDCAGRYGRSVRNWPAFPDSAGALQYLKKYYRLVILSNVDNESFSHSNQKARRRFRCDLHRGRYRLVQARPSGISPTGSMLDWTSFCTPPKACSMTTGRRTAGGPEVMLDFSPSRRSRFWGDHASRRHAALLLPLHQHGGIGERRISRSCGLSEGVCWPI